MSNTVNTFKEQAISIVIVGCSFFTIFIFLYCGLFAVASADDYAYANTVINHNFWQSQIDSYLGWSGRYTATLLITCFGKYFLQNYWLVPWLSLNLLLFSTLFLYWTIFFRLRRTGHFLLFPLGFFAIFLSSSIAGHGVGVINEGFFWLSGAATYQIGAVFYFLSIANFIWMARDKYKIINLVFAIIFTSLSIGSNETLMLLNLGTIIVLCWLYRKRFQLNFIIITCIAIACCSVVFFAPGNNVRSSLAEGHQFFSALGICAEKTVQIFFFSICNPFLWLFVIFFKETIDKLVCIIEQHIALRYFYFSLGMLIYCLYFPVAWALDSGAPDRLVSFIGFLCMAGSVFFLRVLLQQMSRFISLTRIRLSFSVLAIFLSPFILEPLYVAIRTIPNANEFHQKHMQRNAYVEKMAQKGNTSVGVKAIEHSQLLLFRDLETPDHSISYAKYYRLQSVFIVE